MGSQIQRSVHLNLPHAHEHLAVKVSVLDITSHDLEISPGAVIELY